MCAEPVEVVRRDTLLAPRCDCLQTATGAGASHVVTRVAAGGPGKGSEAVGLQVEINE
jgi:hypothetical protein